MVGGYPSGGGYPGGGTLAVGSTPAMGGTPAGGYPGGEYPSRGGYPSGGPTQGTPPDQHSVYLLHGGRYASCVHAGGLSCIQNGNRSESINFV